MRTTIDRAGRVVVPKELRRRLGLRGGEAVEIRLRDGVLEIEVAPVEMSLESREGALVAVPHEELPPLTADEVREAIDNARR